MSAVRNYFVRAWTHPTIRPLGLVVPIIVLVIALPLLRPLRHPSDVSRDEALRLATIRALVEQRSPAIERYYAATDRIGTIERDGHLYSAQPPMQARLLTLPAWVMLKMGFSFDENHLLISYLLTLMGVTLPVALSGGLIYRMGRLFDLPRLWRAALAIAVMFGSGLVSYSVVLNQQAAAAALIIASAACLVHVAAVDQARHRWIWMLLCGMLAGFATTVDPPAGLLAVLFLFVIPALRYSISFRAAGVALYILGAGLPLLLHAQWNVTSSDQQVLPQALAIPFEVHSSAQREIVPGFPEETDGSERSLWSAVRRPFIWIARCLFGAQGVLSHFPILIFGVAGVFAVMHRHWPSATKVLAAATLTATVTIILIYCVAYRAWSDGMFGVRWFVVFAPMLVFWLGAWVRRSHKPITWVFAAALLAFSVVVGLIGATGPAPAEGLRGYTALAAAKRMLVASPAGDTGDKGRTQNRISGL